MRKFISIIILSLLSGSTFGQAPTLQQKLYYAGKVWGFVKYFHSEVSTCKVNWDSVLLHTLPLIEGAATSGEFNDALDTMLAAAGPMAISTSYFPDTLPLNRKRNRDWSWTSSPALRIDVQIQLDTIKNNFRPHPECWAGTAPNTKTLYDPWGGYLELGADTLLLQDTTYITYPDEDHRLLELFKFWNIVRYFNPYNYVLDVSWDTTLSNYVIPVASVSDAASLERLYLKMAKELDDAHVYGLTYGAAGPVPPGYWPPLLRLKYMGGQYIVVGSKETGIYPGDAVVSIDGMTPTQWEDSLRPYYSAGNQAVFHRTVAINVLSRVWPDTTETLVIADSTGTNHTFNLICRNPAPNYSFFDGYYYPNDSLTSVLWDIMPCDIGYVNMATLQSSDAAAMYSALQDKSAIIFDLRNDAFAEGYVVPFMCPDWRPFATLSMPDTTYPGTYSYEQQFMGYPGNPTPYKGKVILLIGEGSQSHVEYSAMFFDALPNVIKVGSQTAGADGNITWLGTTCDMRFGWTSLGVYYPNGDSTQRIGIVPDSVVYSTAKGIRHKRDEVLEKALAIAGCNLFTSVDGPSTSPASIRVIPNPANDRISVEGVNISGQHVRISITDVAGRILMQKEVDNNNQDFTASFDIRELSPGMYFVTLKTVTGQYVSKIVKE